MTPCYSTKVANTNVIMLPRYVVRYVVYFAYHRHCGIIMSSLLICRYRIIVFDMLYHCIYYKVTYSWSKVVISVNWAPCFVLYTEMIHTAMCLNLCFNWALSVVSHQFCSFNKRNYFKLYYPLTTALEGIKKCSRLWLVGRVDSWMDVCVRGSVTLYLVDTIVTKVFAQQLSNFTCKLWMMRGGTLLILGHGVKCQGQLWDSVYKTLWAGYFAQSLSNFTCKLWMMRGRTLLILGHRVKGQGQLWHSVYKTLWTR